MNRDKRDVNISLGQACYTDESLSCCDREVKTLGVVRRNKDFED